MTTTNISKRTKDLVNRSTTLEFSNPYLEKREILPFIAGELDDSPDRDFRRIIQIIESDNLKIRVQELERGVAANVAGPSGHQNGRRRHWNRKFDRNRDQNEISDRNHVKKKGGKGRAFLGRERRDKRWTLMQRDTAGGGDFVIYN